MHLNPRLLLLPRSVATFAVCFYTALRSPTPDIEAPDHPPITRQMAASSDSALPFRRPSTMPLQVKGSASHALRLAFVALSSLQHRSCEYIQPPDKLNQYLLANTICDAGNCASQNFQGLCSFASLAITVVRSCPGRRLCSLAGIFLALLLPIVCASFCRL